MAKYKAYTVTVGRKIGVFTRWLDVVPNITRVSGAQYQGFPDWGSANEAFEDALARGETKIVMDGPPKTHTHRPKQEPTGRRGTGTRSSTSLSSAGRAARNAIIAAALEEAKRERQCHGTGGARDGVQGPSTKSMTRAQAHTAPPMPPKQTTSHPTAQGGQNPKSKTSDPSTSSSPPTGVTQVETSAESTRSPRYAQSLSYASDASPASMVDVHMASPATGSSALASSDRRSDVSLPSTGVTKYFPEDFATRPRDRYTRPAQNGDPKLVVLSPAPTVSEYATPSGSAQTQSSILSPMVSPNLEPPATQSTAGMSSPAMPASSGPTRRVRRRKTGADCSDAAIQVDSPSRKRGYVQASIQASEERRLAAAEVQTSPMLWEQTVPLRATTSATGRAHDACGCEHPEYVCRHCGLPAAARAMQSVANRIATPTAVSEDYPAHVSSPPARSTASSSVHSAVGSPTGRSSVDSPAARSSTGSPALRSPFASPAARSTVASPAARSYVASPAAHSSFSSPGSRSSVRSPMSFSSPLAFTELASSPPSSSATASPASYHSALSSPTEGHTPLLGSSERRSDSFMSEASLQDGLDMLVQSAPARNSTSSPVLHDTSFDPRSPIHRGTMIPAGSGFDSLMRPSPVLTPLNSLLFS